MQLRIFNQKSVLIILLFIFLLLPYIVNLYLLFVINIFFISILLALGLNFLLGYAGQFAFACGAFYGIGAYTAMLLQLKLGMPYWVSLPMAGIFSAIIGTVIAIPALRLRGLYLAILTVSFALLTQWVFIHWESLTFGAGGHKSPVPSFELLNLTSEQGMYYVSLFIAVIMILAGSNIVSSRIGRAFVAIKDSEIVGQTLGINLTKYKAIAFGLSAFYAGIAGGLLSAVLRFVGPEGFDFFQIVTQFTMVVIGGLGSILGSVIGAAVVVILIETTKGLQSLQEIIFGALILIFVIFLPDGIYSIIKRRKTAWREYLSRGAGLKP